MSRVRLSVGIVALVAIVGVSGCQNGVRAGAKCRTTDFGADATYVLKCTNGRWVRIATKAQVAQLVIAILQARTTTSTTVAAPPAGVPLTGVAKVALGSFHSCALMVAGTVKCWGRGNLLGTGFIDDSLVAVVVPGIVGATDIAVGSQHTCVIVALGAAKCWGYNNSGQIGNGTTSSGQASPVLVIGLTGAVALTAGAFHTALS